MHSQQMNKKIKYPLEIEMELFVLVFVCVYMCGRTMIIVEKKGDL